jgi:hypothetical protein
MYQICRHLLDKVDKPWNDKIKYASAERWLTTAIHCSNDSELVLMYDDASKCALYEAFLA